jgi:hypothetical protein
MYPYPVAIGARQITGIPRLAAALRIEHGLIGHDPVSYQLHNARLTMTPVSILPKKLLSHRIWNPRF